MNLETIIVELKSKSENDDILCFIIDNKCYEINLNDASCQNSLKMVFSKLLDKTIDNDVEFDFRVEDGFTREMYIEICDEYLKDLERELSEVKEKIRSELR